jgi:DNA-directed RNA polymerase subunit K/omega
MEEQFDVRNHLKEAIDKVGGPFKATSLVQKRLKSLNQGAQKLVDVTSRNLFDIAFVELLEDKIALEKKEQEPKSKVKKKTKKKKEE